MKICYNNIRPYLKMKIEFISKYLTGGGELITLSLIKCLHDTEPNIKFILYCENSKKSRILKKFKRVELFK